MNILTDVSFTKAAVKATRITVVFYVIIKQLSYNIMFEAIYWIPRLAAGVVMLIIAFGIPCIKGLKKKQLSWLLPLSLALTEVVLAGSIGGDRFIYIYLIGCALVSFLFMDTNGLLITISWSFAAAAICIFIGRNFIDEAYALSGDNFNLMDLIIIYILIYLIGKYGIGAISESMQKAEAAQRTVAAMFESSPYINGMFDNSSKLIDCNPVACAFMGFENKEDMLAGFNEWFVKSIPEFQPDGRASIPITERFMVTVRDGHIKFETELNIDGKSKTVEIEMRRIPYGDSFAIVFYMFDLTETREREMELIKRGEQLRKAIEEAQKANRAKSDFLATMSHEIRTPLNAILGMAQIQMQQDDLPGKYADAFEKIQNSGNALLGIINDILDLSKIETGKLELNPSVYNIPDLINDTVQLNTVRIGSKPIEFILEVDENLPSKLLGDELRLKQILNNLLSNAVKYTEKGHVALSVSKKVCSTDNEVLIIFSISDTGQGMKSEDMKRLFTEYQRFNIEANRSTEGTGLGLTITKRLVTMMNGDISVQSEYGKGSIFTVTVKQRIMDSTPIGAEVAAKLRGFAFVSEKSKERRKVLINPMPYGSVLVVDDVESNLLVAKGLLLPYKLKIETADSGFAAIEKIENGETFDVIFMDHMMPRMDGIETTQKLRESGYKGVIVALTANALVGNDEKFAKNGFDGYISKPIDIRHLDEVLNKFIRDKYPEEAKKHKQETTEVRKPDISAKYMEIFLKETEKAVVTLRETANGDIKLFTTTVHALKTSLGYIGEKDLSKRAAALEAAGRNEDTEFIAANAEGFIEALKVLVERLRPAETAVADNTDISEDTAYLTEQLLIIKAACDDYDDKTVYAALDSLKEKQWKPQTSAALEEIRDTLFLDSDFEEAAKKTSALMELAST